MKLGHLKGSGILPFLDVSIVLIKLNGMVVILWDCIAIHVAWHHTVGPELGLVNHPEKSLLATFNFFHPSRSSQFCFLA